MSEFLVGYRTELTPGPLKPGASFVPKDTLVYEQRVRMTSLVGKDWKVGPVMPDLDWPKNHLLAFTSRMGRQVPRPDLAALDNFVRFVRHVAPVAPICVDLSGRGWIEENPSYSARRKRELLWELETGQSASWARSEVQRVQAFGKNEPQASLSKAMRFIYAREDRFKVAFAPWIRPIERLVYSGKHFVKGWTKLEIQDQMLTRIEPFEYKWVGDHHTFEATVGPAIMERVIAPFYAKFGIPEGMLAVITGVNHIHSRQGRMRVRACTMSGEVDTSLRNGLINHFLMAFTVALARRSGKVKADWLVEGDDVIIGADRPLPLEEAVRALGFDFTCDRIATCGDSGFCGWYFGPSGKALKPPAKVLKLGWTFGCERSKRRRQALFAGKLMSASMEYASSPLVWSMLRDFEFAGKAVMGRTWKELPGFRLTKSGWWEAAYAPIRAAEPTMEDRECYARLFDMSVAEQMLIEAQGVITSPMFAIWLARKQPREFAYLHTHQR